jgi:stearoyl-CoA desaturase (Delta-9 desaturase)
MSLFFQTFFLHRYAAHKMFTMNQRWEKVFFILTFIAQGSSYLNPKAYAVLHRMHHAYSDTKKDPHSPYFFRSVVAMMLHTKKIYQDLVTNKMEAGKNFDKNVPVWATFDKLTDLWMPRILWALFYITFYIIFATNWWMFLLLPVHFLMGPIHGAIVNWCGHKYGYVNFRDTKDNSKNTLLIDFLTLGELFQNNHHKFPSRPNFAFKRIEFDPTYPIIKILDWIGIIKLDSGNKIYG